MRINLVLFLPFPCAVVILSVAVMAVYSNGLLYKILRILHLLLLSTSFIHNIWRANYSLFHLDIKVNGSGRCVESFGEFVWVIKWRRVKLGNNFTRVLSKF